MANYFTFVLDGDRGQLRLHLDLRLLLQPRLQVLRARPGLRALLLHIGRLSSRSVGFGGLEAFCLFLFSFHFVSSFLWYYKLVESAGPFCMYISVYTVGLAALFPLLAFFYAELYMKTRNGRNTEWYSEGLTLVRSIPI